MNEKKKFDGTREEWNQYIVDFSVKLANELQKHIQTEEDLWWFVMEQYDRIRSYANAEQLLPYIQLGLYEIEYDGRRSEHSYVGKRNPGSLYMNDHMMPQLLEMGGKWAAELVAANTFNEYCRTFKSVIDSTRLEHAVHFHNNCISTGSFSFADQWNEVIQALDPE